MDDSLDFHATIIRTVASWPEDARVTWNERAAIREYDGGMDRKDAERFAFFEVKRALEGKPPAKDHKI